MTCVECKGSTVAMLTVKGVGLLCSRCYIGQDLKSGNAAGEPPAPGSQAVGAGGDFVQAEAAAAVQDHGEIDDLPQGYDDPAREQTSKGRDQ